MNLRECVDTVAWPDVRERLLALYGDDDAIDPDDYEAVFQQLRRLTPLPQTMRLVIRQGADLSGFDDEDEEEEDADLPVDGDELADEEAEPARPEHHVVGHDGTLCVEEEPELYGNDPRGQEEVAWGLVFTPWQEWLGMDLDRATLDAYALPDIVAHCLWEMTFYGFDQRTIRDQAHRFERALADETDTDLDDDPEDGPA